MLGSGIGSLWFLCSVLASSVAVAICGKISDKNSIQIIAVLLGIVIVAVFPNRDMNLYMYPYFVIGFFFAKYKEKIPSFVLKLQYLSLIVFPVMLVFYTKDHYIYTTGLHIQQYNNIEAIGIDMFRWAIGLIGSVFAITVAQVIFNFFRNLDKKQFPYVFFEKLGEKSLQIYCLQCTFLSFWLPIVYSFLINRFLRYNILSVNMTLYNIVYTPLIAIGYSVGLLLVVKIMRKTKISYVIFGR